MPGPSNSSFIPKRGPVKQKRAKKSRQVYIFTIISYVLLFATLLAAGGVFLYGGYIDRQLDSEIAALNREISSFSEGDMQRVLDFDLRLQQAGDRLENSVSIVSLMQAIEASTIDTVRLERLNLERVNDSSYSLLAAIQTDSFDSTIFQRDVYEDSDEFFSSVTVSTVRTSSPDNRSEEESVSNGTIVTFTADLEIPLEAIPYVPNPTNTIQQITAPTVIIDSATEEALLNPEAEDEEAETDVTNQDGV